MAPCSGVGGGGRCRRVGDPLLQLDTSDLEQAAPLAELDVATSQNSFDQLREPASASELAEARDLTSAQQQLADAREPATAALNSLRRAANVAFAWATHNHLRQGPSAAEFL